MDAALEAKLKSYNRLGTYLVELPVLSKTEGMPCVVQLRRLKGQDFSQYLREQNRLAYAMNKLRQAQRTPEQTAKPDDASLESGTVPNGMNESEEKNVFQIVASMRALLQNAVMRLFIDAPDGLQVYKVVQAPPGDHAENEVSLDVMEPEFSILVNRMLIKSGLLPDVPFPPVGQADAGDTGRSGEAVQPTTESAGAGVVG